ncbi:GntR family transcriptional regulator [Demequina aestuarii]|uniref:GntR family transcriptional regulator n=1 Tax=Demequina aestuarii TaxID=327095 RepID=UPI000784DB04|nr:GntR family transcriptional regulator [Demequina aestuarii]
MSPTPSSTALVDELADRIREMILSGEVPVGRPLRQADLAEQFGISRTPVREALRQLHSTGLIELHPHRGAIVRVPVPWEVRETYEVRAELEALAARRAATRLSSETISRMREANDALYALTMSMADAPDSAGAAPSGGVANEYALHPAIHEAAENARLTRMLHDINLSYPRNVPAVLLVENVRHREENHHDHVDIIDALAEGDGDRAATLMRAHVLKTGDQVARWYERHSDTTVRG